MAAIFNEFNLSPEMVRRNRYTQPVYETDIKIIRVGINLAGKNSRSRARQSRELNRFP